MAVYAVGHGACQVFAILDQVTFRYVRDRSDRRPIGRWERDGVPARWDFVLDGPERPEIGDDRRNVPIGEVAVQIGTASADPGFARPNLGEVFP
ncbi:MAG: hypothetical protein ACE5MM_07780 [Nitrospiraceae bacterium]